MISVIFEQATIVDGTGAAPLRTDVGIVDDRIALIGDLADREAAERVECSGRVLAPGFIDVRSHSDEQWLTQSRLANKLLQGCTSVIGGHGAQSGAFITRDHAGRFDTFLEAVASIQPGVNIGALASFSAVAKCTNCLPLLRDAWDGGAFGISAQTRDVDNALGVASEIGADVLSIDLRDASDLTTATDAILRAARQVAVRAGSFRTRAPDNGAALYRALKRCAASRDGGCDIVLDTFPYVNDRVALTSLLRGVQFPVQPLDEAALRAATALISIALDGRLDRTILAGTRDDDEAPWYGYSIAEYAQAHRVSNARAAFDLLQHNEGDVDAFVPATTEDDLVTAFSSGFVLPATDDTAFACTAQTHRLSHPRAFGTFPRMLARFAAQRHALTFEDAIASMTSRAADAYGLHERGRIVPGYYADVTIFQRGAFIDTATYAQPHTFPTGLDHVYVNGRPAVRNGSLTGQRAGRILRRGQR